MKKVYFYLLQCAAFFWASHLQVFAQVYDLGVPVVEIKNKSDLPSQITDSVSYYLYELDMESLNELNKVYHDSIILKLRYKEVDLEVLLFPNKNMFYFDTYKVDGVNKFRINYNKGKYYFGNLKNSESASLVSLSFFENTMMGVISYEGLELSIFPFEDPSKRKINSILLGVMEESQIKVSEPFYCEVGDLESGLELQRPINNMRSGKLCFESYLEIDYPMFQHFRNEVATLNWVSSMYNAVSTVYFFEEINASISEIVVWTQQDPYPTGASTSDNLLAFRSAMANGFNGDLAHLIAWRNSSGEGRAYVGTICNTFNFGTKTAFSRVAPSIRDYPNYNRTIKVITHEIGHNLGSRHTHRCVWNNNNTQIDDYGNVYPNGSLPSEQEGAPCWNFSNPRLSELPTIMSYYDSFGHGSFPMSNGFGIQPGNLIRSFLSNCPNCVIPQIEAICIPDTTIYLDSSGLAVLNASDLDNGSTGLAMPLTFSIRELSQWEFNCEDIGVNTLELVVRDQLGNTASCISEVSVGLILDLNAEITALSSVDSTGYCMNQKGILYKLNMQHVQLPCQFDSISRTLDWYIIDSMGVKALNSRELLSTSWGDSVIINLDNSLMPSNYKLVCKATLIVFKNSDSFTFQAQAAIDFNISDELAPEKVNIYLYPGDIFYFEPLGGYFENQVPCFEWGYRSAESNSEIGDVIITRESQHPRISESGFALFAKDWDKLDKIIQGDGANPEYYLWVDKWLPHSNGSCDNKQGVCITRTYFNSSLPPIGAPRSSADPEIVSLTLYPNPNRGSFNIKLDNDYIGNYKISIMDSYSRIIWNSSIEKSEASIIRPIHTIDLVSGIYFLVIRDSFERMGMQKLIIW